MHPVLIRKKVLPSGVFVLGLVAICALLQKTSLLPHFFKICTDCNSPNSCLPYFGLSYFSLLLAIPFWVPAFPGRNIAKGGLVLALLLALTLTLINLPHVCPACLISHLCHILIWIIWLFSPSLKEQITLYKRILFTAIAPTLIFLVSISLKFFPSPAITTTGLRPGQTIPKAYSYISDSSQRGVIINFISSDCPFCKAQLPMLNAIAEKFQTESFRFISISPVITEELRRYAPCFEWIEDEDGLWHEEFQILAHPTLFVIDSNSKITQIISGLPKTLQESLLLGLAFFQNDQGNPSNNDKGSKDIHKPLQKLDFRLRQSNAIRRS